MTFLIQPIISRCHKCGKTIRKTVDINGSHYGIDCASEILGLNADDWSAPLFLYGLADEYLKNIVNSNYNYSWISDLASNFFGTYSTSGTTWETALTICGDRISVKNQLEIARYLGFTYADMTCRQISDFSDGNDYLN